MLNLTKHQTAMLSKGLKTLIFGVCVLAGITAQAAPNQIAPRIASAASATVSVQAENSGPLTFQSWKNLRVDEARLILERISYENQLDKMPIVDRSPGEKQAVIRTADTSPRAIVGNRPNKSPRADSRAEQARMNLEIAQDLTVNDYLVIYLSQFKSRDAILDVARRLAPEDIADLLISYQKLAIGGQIAEHSMVPVARTPPRAL